MSLDKKKNKKDHSKDEPKLVGGFGEMCNRGTQYHFQNRVYDSNSVSVSLTTAFNPSYLVKK